MKGIAKLLFAVFWALIGVVVCVGTLNAPDAAYLVWIPVLTGLVFAVWGLIQCHKE